MMFTCILTKKLIILRIVKLLLFLFFYFFFQAEDGIRDVAVTGVQTCALPIYRTYRRFAISEGLWEEVFDRQRTIVFLGLHNNAYCAHCSGTNSVLFKKSKVYRACVVGVHFGAIVTHLILANHIGLVGVHFCSQAEVRAELGFAPGSDF